MPLKIVPTRSKITKVKNLYIRGSYLGVPVDQSARTDSARLAKIVKKRIEGEIERGEYGKRVDPEGVRREPTFLSAAIAYMEDGYRRRYVQPLIDYFKDTPLSEIDQAAIDRCALALHPRTSPSTRNTCVYTPVSAILHHAGVQITLRRPKGAKGKPRTNWLTPADAFGWIMAADAIEPELATLMLSLLFTGPRISAALDVRRADFLLDEAAQWARPQKGQDAHAVKLKSELVDRLRELLASHDRQRVFRWHYGGHLKWLLVRSKLEFLGIPCPAVRPRRWREPPNRLKGYTFHTFRHTWGTWMRRYAGATVDDLIDSGNWKDRRAAQRYVHSAPTGLWDAVERLPAMPGKKQA